MILVAYVHDTPVGCKIAYDRYRNDVLYSWLGAVLPDHRKKGVAQILQNELEHLAKEKGYKSILLKTRNKFKAMLQFSLKNDFQIVAFEKKDKISENRIVLSKII